MKIQRYKRNNDYSYALGMTLTIELLKTKPQYVELVYISQRIEENENYRYLKKLCLENSIAIEKSEKAFNILSPKGNCFVIGVFRKFDTQLDSDNHIVLVNPSDTGNMGTIIRTAIGFNITNLAIVSPAVDIFDPKVVRASMGALFHINFKYYEDFSCYEAEFSSHSKYPFMLKASTPIQNVNFAKPFALVFGNEATGLPDSFSELHDSVPVVIPHSDNIDSLNLPMATGIAMFSATKDNWG